MSRVLVLNGPPGIDILELAQLLKEKYKASVLSTFAAGVVRSPRIIVPDLGLFAEMEHLVNIFGAKYILLVHLLKDGCSYGDDPREYVDYPGVDAVTVTDQTTFTLSLLAFLFFELPIY